MTVTAQWLPRLVQQPTPPPFRQGSLFSGYEGLGLAVKAVFPHAETAFVADIDPGACKILAHRFPSVPNLGDVSTIDWTPWRGLIEIITAGFPCQDVSAAGKQAGLVKGTRTGLWHETARAIAELRPPLVYLENVRGLLSARGDEPTDELERAWAHRDLCDRLITHLSQRHARAVREGRTTDARRIATRRVRVMGLRKRAVDAARRADRRIVRAIGTVLGSLADLGYDAAWVGLRAADVGAPHGRWRVFILAWPADTEGIPGFVVDGDGRLAADTDSAGRSERRGPLPVRPEHPAAEHARQDALTLLKTPTAQLAVNGGSQHPDKRKAGGHGATLADEVEHLLPTPAVNDMGEGKTVEHWDGWTASMKAKHGNGNGHGKSLAIEAQRLLPTPRASDGPDATSHGRTWSKTDRSMHTVVHLGEIDNGRWGDYAPAIHRWEQAHIGPAPAATETSSKGTPQLSPRFTEWLMGLASGWITDVPEITRNEALKASGNGVVPQQGAEALRWLLNVMARVLATADRPAQGKEI